MAKSPSPGISAGVTAAGAYPSAPEQSAEHAADELRAQAGRAPTAPAEDFPPDFVGDLPAERRRGGAAGGFGHLAPGGGRLRAFGGQARAFALLGDARSLL